MKEVVVAVIVKNDDRLLLVQQQKPSAYAGWSYPGGHVEAGESLLDALRREVQEETGATLTQAEPLRVDKRKNRAGNDFEHHAFVGRIEGGVTVSDELMGFGWFTLNDLTAMKLQLRADFILDLAHAVLGDARA